MTRCAVRALDFAAGRVAGVVTERGAIAAEAVVVAGGAWSSLLLRRHGVHFPQLKVLSSVLRSAPAPEVFPGGLWAPGISLRRRLDGGYTIAHGARSAFDLVPDLLRHFGAFLPAFRAERRGLSLRLGRRFFEELGYEGRWRDGRPTPFERQRVLDPAPVAGILETALRNLREAFPTLAGLQVVERWAGLIDVTPDAVPAISQVEGARGLYLASGFSGHGFGIGPGAGRLMAELVTGERPCVDPAPFRHSRFLDGTRLRPSDAI